MIQLVLEFLSYLQLLVRAMAAQGQQMNSRRAEGTASLTEPLLAVSVARPGNDGGDSDHRNGYRRAVCPGNDHLDLVSAGVI